MAVRTFDPKSVIIAIGGVPMSGFADGTFLEITADTQQFTKVIGADGYATRVKTNNYGGVMTLTLSQSSPSNDVLSALLNADRVANAGVVPILIKDLSGTTIIFSATGWIQQFPDSAFGNAINNRAWAFDLAEMDVFIGGNGENP
jgi:hypothetical protein